jgi:hypothetical protein
MLSGASVLYVLIWHLTLTLPLSRSTRYFAERPQASAPEAANIPIPSTGRPIPHACIAFISLVERSTFNRAILDSVGN